MKAFIFAIMALGALSVAANAEPVKLDKQQMQQVVAGKITPKTTNPGGQTGGCGNNKNCTTVNVNPQGKAPAGQNK
jgi:hypothetical protein